jgi:hypothetical protein
LLWIVMLVQLLQEKKLLLVEVNQGVGVDQLSL